MWPPLLQEEKGDVETLDENPHTTQTPEPGLLFWVYVRRWAGKKGQGPHLKRPGWGRGGGGSSWAQGGGCPLKMGGPST